MKFSWRRLIRSSPFLLNHLRLLSPELDPIYFRLLFCTPSTLSQLLLSCPTRLITTLHGPRKRLFTYPLPSNGCHSIVACTCVAGRCCLAIGIQVTIFPVDSVRAQDWIRDSYILRITSSIACVCITTPGQHPTWRSCSVGFEEFCDTKPCSPLEVN
jgi:hypothetical protein